MTAGSFVRRDQHPSSRRVEESGSSQREWREEETGLGFVLHIAIQSCTLVWFSHHHHLSHHRYRSCPFWSGNCSDLKVNLALVEKGKKAFHLLSINSSWEFLRRIGGNIGIIRSTSLLELEHENPLYIALRCRSLFSILSTCLPVHLRPQGRAFFLDSSQRSPL